MPSLETMKLTLTKETLAELTADDLSAVIGGNHEESASCTLAAACTTSTWVPPNLTAVWHAVVACGPD